MDKLNPNWLTEGRIDFEYKKYVLLAYLQDISKHFNESKLYPFLADLIFHYRYLTSLQNTKEQTQAAFPKRVKRVDLENFRLEYERMMHDDEYMEEIQSILNFAIPKLKEGVEDGKELYDFVEEQLDVSPIGIIPLSTEFGYLFLKTANIPETKVYDYQITLFEKADEKFRGIKTSLAGIYYKSITTTFESIKHDLIKKRKNLPNPATFLIQSRIKLPEEETLLPVAKRYFVQFLARVQAGKA